MIFRFVFGDELLEPVQRSSRPLSKDPSRARRRRSEATPGAPYRDQERRWVLVGPWNSVINCASANYLARSRAALLLKNPCGATLKLIRSTGITGLVVSPGLLAHQATLG